MTNGFLDTRHRSPLGLGLVVALHAAALTAVILAKGPQILPRPEAIQIFDVPDPAPPPEALPPPPETKAEPAASRLDTPEVLIRTPQVPEVALPPLPPLIPETTQIARTEPLPIDPPAQPVLRDAVMAARSVAQPPYPPAMARQEIEGVAVVRVTIGADGRVRDVVLVRADDPAFFEATRRHALRSWRFSPATRDGVPVESVRTMTVRFEMG